MSAKGRNFFSVSEIYISFIQLESSVKFPEKAMRKSRIALFYLKYAFVIDQSEKGYFVEYKTELLKLSLFRIITTLHFGSLVLLLLLRV